MKIFLIFLFLTTLFPLNLLSYFEDADSSEITREMNGIKYDDLKDFTKKWHLVTVRYRQDSSEMRIVFANDLAWKSMKSLKPAYPDGAMFGKVGILTEKDPAFPSSITPAGAKRYQFMVKDQKKYPESDGWGYALFQAKGNLFKGDIKTQTTSCVACHRIVPERDFVFSRPMLLHHDSAFSVIPTSTNNVYRFESKHKKDLPILMKSEINENTKEIESLTGQLQKKAFSGTLDEIIPLLIERSKSRQKTAALIINDQNFSFVQPIGISKECEAPKNSYQIIIFSNSKKVRDGRTCE